LLGSYIPTLPKNYLLFKLSATLRKAWVYPQGVDGGQSSQRLRGMAVMFYMMGLSYGATALVLHSLGVGMGKTSVYRVVQEVVEKVPGMKRKEIAMGYQTKAVGVDVTSVKCKGKWLTIAIAVDATNGFVLSIDELSGQETADLKELVITHN
jgi:hypothetical protein